MCVCVNSADMHGYKQCMMTCNLPIIPHSQGPMWGVHWKVRISFHLSCDKKLYQNQYSFGSVRIPYKGTTPQSQWNKGVSCFSSLMFNRAQQKTNEWQWKFPTMNEDVSPIEN